MSKHIENVKEFHRKAKQGIANKPIIPSEEVRLLRAKLIFEETLETIEAMGVEVDFDHCSLADTWGIETEAIKEGAIVFNIDPYKKPDLVEVADGCADINYVVTGTQLEFGIPIEEVQAEVDRSNADKFTGDYTINESGKIIKPSDWKAPDIASILEKHRWEK